MKEYDTKELAGQRIMAGFDGTVLNNEIKYLIKNLKIGGLILFSRNIESPDQVKDLCSSAQEFTLFCNLPPLFISIDQEGGDVARLKHPFFTLFPGNPQIKEKNDAINFAAVTAHELKAINVNMNLAPVMDYAPEESNSIMKNRAFCGSPEKVAKLGTYIINELQKQGIMACAKHFPGIGRTILDSHLHLPVLDADRELLKKTDLIPFLAAKENNVCAIMLSHILYTEIDKKWPASLSPEIAKKWLRDEIGFQGIVMTDDLDMKAVKHDIKTSVKQILKSEIDITLICHKGPDIETAFKEIHRTISEEKYFFTKGVESFKRILKAKTTYLQ
ncbi:MAG: glycoside hydrolase family 3 N-terminal domain-containing protein [Thermodesulfobacteriota bacterium]|nr:glycoside hydrolase family 3 N-terminal domain-containing protein [Thermodesulfobacteriota bacterium]